MVTAAWGGLNLPGRFDPPQGSLSFPRAFNLAREVLGDTKHPQGVQTEKRKLLAVLVVQAKEREDLPIGPIG